MLLQSVRVPTWVRPLRGSKFSDGVGVGFVVLFGFSAVLDCTHASMGWFSVGIPACVESLRASVGF